MRKTYHVKVFYRDDGIHASPVTYNVVEDVIKIVGNINKYIFKDSCSSDIIRITVKSPERKSVDITYDAEIEKFKQAGERVEIHWKKGWEDYSGYGCRTEGKIARGYIGRSTGWIPIYLLILTSKSSGGASLCHAGIESIKGLGTYR